MPLSITSGVKIIKNLFAELWGAIFSINDRLDVIEDEMDIGEWQVVSEFVLAS